jgi:hypothetical protein
MGNIVFHFFLRGAIMSANKDKPQPPARKEDKLVASPIQATPVLRGQDLVDLVNDFKRPDTNKEERQRALKILKSISKDKK